MIRLLQGRGLIRSTVYPTTVSTASKTALIVYEPMQADTCARFTSPPGRDRLIKSRERSWTPATDGLQPVKSANGHQNGPNNQGPVFRYNTVSQTKKNDNPQPGSSTVRRERANTSTDLHFPPLSYLGKGWWWSNRCPESCSALLGVGVAESLYGCPLSNAGAVLGVYLRRP